ncbi:MAG: hypothetical protein V7609_1050 [Verrucomicrobiota bacterium]
MPEINILRAIKPKKGMYIAEGRSEYVGKHPYGQGASGFWVGFKIMWRSRFFSSQGALLVLPDLCVGVSRISDKQARSETRWSAFSAGQKGTPIAFGALGGLLSGAVRTAFAEIEGLSGFAVYYVNEAQSTGGLLAAAPPDIVEQIFSVMPEDKIIPLPR